MYTTIALKKVLDSIEGRLKEGKFNLAIPYKFSRSLDFSYNLHKDIVNVRQTLLENQEKYWLCMAWNRGPVETLGHIRRRDRTGIKVYGKDYADFFWFQTVITSVNVRFFCSSLDYMETLEEWICTRMIEQQYNVDYPGYIDDVEILLHEIEYPLSDQLETREFGTIGYVDISFKVSYPAIFDSERRPIILEINYNIYDNTVPPATLLSENQILAPGYTPKP